MAAEKAPQAEVYVETDQSSDEKHSVVTRKLLWKLDIRYAT